MTLVQINYKKVAGLTFLPLLEQAPHQLQYKVNTRMIFSNMSGCQQSFEIIKEEKAFET